MLLIQTRKKNWAIFERAFRDAGMNWSDICLNQTEDNTTDLKSVDYTFKTNNGLLVILL